jgi:dihydroflavonol-4-reductase
VRALVTGSSGHIGRWVVRLLRERGFAVRTFDRQEGQDVRDAALLDKAARGVDVIFHLAMQHWSGRESPAEIEAIAHEGLRNVVAAADGAKIVHTSSTAAVGESASPTPLDERTWNDDPITPYTRAKVSSERLLWELAPNAIAVLPAMTIGPDDPGPTASNARIVAMQRRGWFWFPGGLNIVDVRDVAEGHLAAFERGRAGERYILGGKNLEYRDLMTMVRGRRPPVRIPTRALLTAVSIYERFAGDKPFVTSAQLRKRIGAYAYYSSEKARRELGYAARALDETLSATLRDR